MKWFLAILFFLFSVTISVSADQVGSHHPIEIEIKKKIDLPVQYGKIVACITCHGEHNYTKVSSKAGLLGEIGKDGKLPKFLRKPYSQLCETCHEEKSDPQHNHMNLNASLNSCSQCHKMHSGAKKLVHTGGPELCTKCHKAKTVDHASVATVVESGRAAKVSLDGNKIVCNTCHDPHSTTAKDYYLRRDASVYSFCASCHGQKAMGLYEGFHKSR